MKTLRLASLALAGWMMFGAAGAFAASWQKLPGLPGVEVQSLAFDPVAPRFGLLGALGGAVYRTSNGGQNWVRVQVGNTQDLIGIVSFAPDAPLVAYAVAYSFAGDWQIYATTDGGATWTPTA